MTELERKVRAKIPGPETGIEIKHSICDICNPGTHCGLDVYVKDGRIIVTFKAGPLGVAPRDHILGGFEVAGEDHVFYPATAKVCNDDFRSVEVFCKQVKNPVAVRYCFHNVAEASLFNNYGIPASPFRTDVGE